MAENDQTNDEQKTLALEADPEALDPELAIPRGEEVVSVLEAILFAATQPLNVKRISVLMNGVPETEVEWALVRLRERCNQPTSGLGLMEVGGGWQLATRPEVADWVLRLHRHRKRNALSPSLLECLAIIAYKQPLTRADIEAIRGVDCGTAMRSLQDAGLCEVVGRKEVVGRPPLYGTTELFLKTFGLKDLEQLPSLGDLRKALPAEPAKEEAPPAS
ncbi:SMC-Scp complex subunit ScpB [bacterium]|nr:SMC-Scp complex subunit ScpB [bacterium]